MGTKALFAILLLLGTASATVTYYGQIYGGAKVYFFDDDRAYFGQYQSYGDHSPGSIYLAEGMPTHLLIQTMVHEVCHFRQDMEHRAFDEEECEMKAHQGRWA